MGLIFLGNCSFIAMAMEFKQRHKQRYDVWNIRKVSKMPSEENVHKTILCTEFFLEYWTYFLYIKQNYHKRSNILDNNYFCELSNYWKLFCICLYICLNSMAIAINEQFSKNINPNFTRYKKCKIKCDEWFGCRIQLSTSFIWSILL